MREYVAQAVILDRESYREYDSRVDFFTEKSGKLTGKVVSGRKITSKLSAHVEPANVVNLRFVENGNIQIVDSVKIRKTSASAPDLHALSRILPEGQPEPELWKLLKSRNFSWQSALQILGWGSKESECANCRGAAGAFYCPNQESFCVPCASKLPQGLVIYL